MSICPPRYFLVFRIPCVDSDVRVFLPAGVFVVVSNISYVQVCRWEILSTFVFLEEYLIYETYFAEYRILEWQVFFF